MNQNGITVCGIDSQGCGRSEGLRGIRFYVENFDDYVRDCLQFSRLISGQSDPSGNNSWSDGFEMPPGVAGLPTFISGISLGGCIAYTAALRDSSLFDGSVFLAPMLSLEKASRKGLNPYLKPLAALLSYFIPTAAIVATDRNILYPDIQVSFLAHRKTVCIAFLNHMSFRAFDLCGRMMSLLVISLRLSLNRFSPGTILGIIIFH